MVSLIQAHFKALRPHQWVKNGFVLAPLIFSASITDPHQLQASLMALMAFCLSASGIYLLNDTVDYHRDQQHPKKKFRPIASGQVKRPTAIILALISAGIGLFLAWSLNRPTAFALIVYICMNIAYSLGLKHLFLVDVFFIAFGFLLRVSVGAFAISVRLSPWLLLCTLFIALFLGLCKRRHERSSLGEDAEKHRSILAKYSLNFLDQLILLTATATTMSYALYTIDPWVCARLQTNALLLTIPLVLFGLFRYLHLVYQLQQGGSPTQVVLKDRGIQTVIVIYLGLSLFCIQTHLQLDLTPMPLP